jgi:hypothetical protein
LGAVQATRGTTAAELSRHQIYPIPGIDMTAPAARPRPPTTVPSDTTQKDDDHEEDSDEEEEEEGELDAHARHGVGAARNAFAALAALGDDDA